MAKLQIRNSVEHQVALSAIASVLMLISIGWLSFYTTNRLVVTEKWVGHTHEVIAALDWGLAILTDVEAKQRGYLLTGDEEFLKECRSAQAQITDWSRQIRELTADNSEAQHRLDTLDLLISQRMDLLNSRIQLRQQQGLQAVAQDVASFRESKSLMDNIWQKVAEMRASEVQLLAQRQSSAQATANVCEIIIVTGSSLACVVGIVAFLMARHDLRLRTRAQQEIKASQALLESILDNSPAIVFIKDLAGRYLFVNRRMAEVVGRPRHEIIGKTAFDVNPKDLGQKADEHFQTIVKSGNPLEVEETVPYPDGLRPHLAVKFPVRDAAGKISAVAGISTDITERKQIEHMRLQFQTLFESAPGLYAVLKPDFTVAAVSDAYLNATMTTRGAILGRDFFDIFPRNPDDPQTDGAAKMRASFERVLQNGATDTMAIQRYDMRRPDGTFEERYWSPVNSPIPGHDGHVEFIIHRMEDVTEFVRRKLAMGQSAGDQADTANVAGPAEKMEAEVFRSSQEVKAINEQLRVANQELEAFSYSVSHDLRAPLRHIDGFVDLLRKQSTEKLNDKERRYLNVIANSARQMGMLIDDLLVFSRMGRMELRRARVSMNSLLDEAVKSAQADVGDRQISWKIAELPDVEADAAMLRQVWVNLVNNAVKYTRTRNPALIEAGCNDGGDDEWIFFVRDNGVGFDMQYVHKLFGVFQRLHRSDEFEGTGIGLANVRRIVSRHGGRTWAEGKIDGGATFYFSLPKLKTQPKA